MANNYDTAIRLLPVAATKALLAIDGPAAASFNTIVEAQPAYEGAIGNTITLALTNGGTWVPNIGTLTLTGNAVADETVTIDTTVYTWKAAPTTVAFQVKVGATASDSIDNLIAAINLGTGSGSLYGSLTTVHPTVRAYAGAGDTMDVQTKSNLTLTAVGTLIATTKVMTNATWGATTLADGTNGTNVTFAVTTTAIVCTFATTYSTVSDFEAALLADTTASTLIRTKTAGTTPLYQIATGTDAFAATNLTGGGATTSAAPTAGTTTIGTALPFCCDQAVVLVRNVDTVAGTTKTADVRLWGLDRYTSQWYSLGQLNGATNIAEVSSDRLAHAELISGLRPFTRLYAQIGSLGGAGTEIEVYVDCTRSEPVSR